MIGYDGQPIGEKSGYRLRHSMPESLLEQGFNIGGERIWVVLSHNPEHASSQPH